RSQGRMHLAQDLAHMATFVADRGNAEHDQLAIIQRVDLRDSDIEMVVQPILDAPNHLAFVFEAPRLAKQQTDPKRADNHGVASGRHETRPARLPFMKAFAEYIPPGRLQSRRQL